MAVFLLLAACGDSATAPADDPDSPGPAGGKDPDPIPTAETFCGKLGYPCSITEVDPQVATYSDALLDDVMARVGSGESLSTAAGWLSGQDGIADVAVSGNAIIFRVRGGLPMWFVDTPVDAGSPGTVDVVMAADEDVVGHGTPRENSNHNKKAIVLAPFLFQFASNDVGPALNTLIGGNKEYAGRVDYRAQGTTPGIPTSSTSTGTMSVADFQGWTAYDVVVLSTHGGVMSGGSWGCGFFASLFTCVGAVATGERVLNCGAAFNAVVQAKYAGLQGLRCGGAGSSPGKYIYLDTDFFALEYPVGMDRAIVYFGACKSSADGSLGVRLSGSNSDYFGWDNNVVAAEEKASATRLFQLMLTNGFTTTDAFDQLESEGGTVTSGAKMLHRASDDGLHIREITNLKNPLHPSVSGSAPALFAGPLLVAGASATSADEPGDLMPGDILPFFGQAGDGQNDEMFFYVDVDGVRSGREPDFDVTVTINGQVLGTWPLDGNDTKRINDYRVRLRIQQPLDFDVQTGSTITLRATANLPGPDDPESYDEVSAMLANPQLHVHSEVQVSGGGVEVVSEVEGDIDLSFERGSQPDELKLGMSMGPLRYVRYEATVPPTTGCTTSTQTFDGRMAIRDGSVSFDDPMSGDFGVPTELVIFPLPEIHETLTTTCAQGSFTLETIHWFSGFVSFHGGGFGGPNELDQSRNGFVVTGWQPGSAGVYARRIYQRTGTDDDVTLTENTTLELRGPSYVPGVSPRAIVAGRTP